MKPRYHASPALLCTVAAMLAGCARPPMTLPGPVTYPRSAAPTGLSIGNDGPTSQRPTSLTVSEVPELPADTNRGASAGGQTPPRPAVAASAEGDDVSMAIEQTPLPMFIQVLYGNVLKRAYSIDPAINARTDIVTFKTSKPIPRARLEEVAVNLLRSYQVTVQDLGGVLRILPDNSPGAIPPPMLRRGKTLPETPESLRPIFQHVELDVVRTSDIGPWLRQIMGTRINVTDDPQRNGFLMSGTQADMRLALELIQTLDQPRLRGRNVKRLTPAHINVVEFAARLNDLLTAQGYAVSSTPGNSSPVLLIPINAIGSLVVFTSNDAIMDLVLRWGQELDKPQAVQTQNGLYTYAVKYADAQELAKTLGEILTGTSFSAPSPAAAAPNAANVPGLAGQAFQQPAAAQPRSLGGRVVVNSATNTLIIRGTNAEEYQQIMALLRELDRPVKSALIEVMVAELRLGGSQALGIEWQLTPRAVGNGSVSGGTLGRLGIGSGGLTLGYANSLGNVVGLLNTLASNNQARILSNPKVMARNGETATIQVGQEVPVITSQQSAGTGGLFGNTSGVLQTVQYRSTGVILKVRPVINSGNRLDLEVSQEVSSAAETRTGVAASPTISTRRVETKLSLRDGSTVLLGGLISRSNSDSNTGIPYLKDIPGVGALFSTQSDSNDQTELLIMITPYVVSDDFESEAITDAIQKTFGDWAQDLRPSRVMLPPAGVAAPAQAPAPTPVPATAPLFGVPPTRPDRANTAPPAAPRDGVAPAMPNPAPTEPPAQAPATAPAAAPAPPPAPGPTSAADPNDGIITSRPLTPPPSPARPAAATASKPASAPAATDPKSNTPAGQRPATTPQGKVVEDEKIKREIEELLKIRKP